MCFLTKVKPYRIHPVSIMLQPSFHLYGCTFKNTHFIIIDCFVTFGVNYRLSNPIAYTLF